MKKPINNQNYFRKMLTMCLLVISVTTFVLTFFFYQKYTEVLTKKLYADQEKNLEQSSQTMKDVYSEISQLYNAVMLDSKVVQFSSLTSFNPAENYTTYLIVKKFYNINPYVNSLYIYNDQANDAITCGSYRFDLKYSWDYLKKVKSTSVFPSTLIQSDEKVLTFAFPIYADNYDTLSGGLFINLDMIKLQNHLFGTRPESSIIFDDEGQILIADNTRILTSDLDTLESMKSWILDSKDVSGSALKEIDGKQYLCSYYKDALEGLTVLCGSPYSELILPLKKQRNLFMTVACLVFVIGSTMQYIITKRLYLPIKKITEELRDSKYAKDFDMDEFALIRHVYEKALDEIEELEQENAVYQPRMKSNLLKGLILGNEDISHAREQFEKNNWNIPFEGMFLSCFLIETCEENELLAPVIQTRIQQLLHEKLGKFLYIECVTISYDQVICLINTIQEMPITFDELAGLLESTKNELLLTYQITLTIGLDGMILNIEDLNNIYHHVMELMRYRFVLGFNQVIYQKRVMALMPECLSYPDKLGTEILNCMVHGKLEEFITDVEKFLDVLRQYTYQPASLLYNRLYLDVLFQLQKISTPDKNIYLNSCTFQFPKTLNHGATMLLNIYNQYQEQRNAVEKLKDNKHFERIEHSKRYIMEHFDDYNLSAGMVADYLGYSTNYFSRIFKSITGFYINDYIRQIRIVKAQQLLTKSDMTIINIAAATGFSNPNYFYSLFKKETGLTPAAYRIAELTED